MTTDSFQDYYVRLSKPAAFRDAMARAVWHPRHGDKAWIESTAEALGPSDGEVEARMGTDGLDGRQIAREMGAERQAQVDVQEMIEAEATASRDEFFRAVQASGDRDLQALSKSYRDIETDLFQADTAYNETIQLEHEDPDLLQQPEYHGLHTPLDPDLVRENPDDAKRKMRELLHGSLDDLLEKEAALHPWVSEFRQPDETELAWLREREGGGYLSQDEYDPDLWTPSFFPDDLWESLVDAGGASSNAILYEWIDGKQEKQYSHLPAFGRDGVRDAKPVAPPKRPPSPDRAELSAALPDGVSIKQSGYGSRY